MMHFEISRYYFHKMFWNLDWATIFSRSLINCKNWMEIIT